MEKVKELYQCYERYIFSYMFGLTMNHHIAEELTQETFLQVLKSFPRFRGDAHVSTWLYKIARNVYSQWKRKNALPEISLDDKQLEIADQQDIQKVLEEQEKQQLITEILRQLPENYREVLWLREWQGLSCEEIAAITAHSSSWVRVNLHRARLSFKKHYLEKEGLL